MNERDRRFKLAVFGLMIVLANGLGLAQVGSWPLSLNLTGLPILIAAFALGPVGGVVSGLFGGIGQAVQQGSWWHLLCTTLLGGAAGLFVYHHKAMKVYAPLMGFIAGFSLLWLMDLLDAERRTFEELLSPNVMEAFSRDITLALPVFALIGGAVMTGLVLFLLKLADEGSFLHLLLAGWFGIIASLLCDALLLHQVQSYPWVPLWFALCADLIQAVIAALLCAWVFQHPRMAEALPVYESRRYW